MSEQYYKGILVFMMTVAIALHPHKSAAQTLAAGDIIFTGYDATSSAGTPDKFSFVALTSIPAGTVIYFTERGYFNTSGWQNSGSSEGTIKWVTGSQLVLGDEILIAGYAATLNGVENGTVTQVVGGNTTGGLTLSSIGDQIIAFQGPNGDAADAGNTNIAGIHWAYCPNGPNATYTTDATWDPINTVGACNAGPNSSSLPSGLLPGISSIWVGFTTSPSIQNYQQGSFNGAGSPFTDAAGVRAAVLDKNNWTRTISNVSGTVPVPCGNIAIVGLGNHDFQPFAVSLYPNPATTDITVTLQDKDTEALLHVYDLQGRMVLQQNLSAGSNKVALHKLSAAVYLMEIKAVDGRKAVRRLVKR